MPSPLTTQEIARLTIDNQIGTVPTALAVVGGAAGYVFASTVMPPMFALAIPAAAGFWLFRRCPSDRDILEIEGGDARKAYKYLSPAQRVQVQQRGVAALPPSPNHDHDRNQQTGINPIYQDHGEGDYPHPRPVAPADSSGDQADLGDGPHAGTGTPPAFSPPVWSPPAGVAVVAPVDDSDDVDPATVWFDELFATPWHAFVYGSTGDGKSTLVCNILARLVKLTPDAEVVIIDPKYPFSEWGGFPVAYKGDKELAKGLDAMGRETATRLQQATDAVNRGEPCPTFAPIIYVLDEANTAFTDHGKTVGDNIKRIISRGRALNVWGVFLGTSSNVGAYGLNVPDLFNCHRFALRSLAPLAIARDETLNKADKDALTRRFNALREDHFFLALLQSEARAGDARDIVVLPQPQPQSINHHENNRSDFATNPISGGTAPLPRSGAGVPGANPGPRNYGGDRQSPTVEPIGISRQYPRSDGGDLNANLSSKGASLGRTRSGAVNDALPDLWGATNDGGRPSDNSCSDGTGARGQDPKGGEALADLPPDSEVLSRFRSGWGICGLAVEYKISNSSPEFDHLKNLEQQYKKELQNA